MPVVLWFRLHLNGKTLVRWVTGKRLTDRLPKVNLITLSAPSEQRALWSSYGAYVPRPKFLTISGDPGRVFIILDIRKFAFL